jgi:soluble lytic murein transglycosylase-like protein
MYQTLLRTDTLNLDYNQEDIYIGLNYLKDLYLFWMDRKNPDRVSWKLSLASYNAGKGRVLQYRGIPPYQQTIDFVAFIYKAHSNPDFYASFSKKYEGQAKSRS